MRMMVYGYLICLARSTGGKAGRGLNKTSTAQVFEGDFLVKQFRFEVASIASRTLAIERAHEFCLNSRAPKQIV